MNKRKHISVIFILIFSFIFTQTIFSSNLKFDYELNADFNQIVILTQSKILSINKDNESKLLYNYEKTKDTYHSRIFYCKDEILFLKYTSNEKYKVYNINQESRNVKQLFTNCSIRDAYNYRNKIHKLYNEDDLVIYEFKGITNREKYLIDKIYNIFSYNKTFEYINWIYYSNELDDNKIYKKNMDESIRKKINNENSTIKSILKDYIIYENDRTGELFKININGSNKIKLSSRQVFDNHIEDYYENIIPYYEPLFIYKNDLYFNVVFPDGGSGTLLMFSKTSLDGEDVEILGEQGAVRFKKKEDWIYYQDTGGLRLVEMGIKRINLNTGKIEVLLDSISTQYSLIGDKIICRFYERVNQNKYIGKIYIMNLDGTEKEILYQEDKGDHIIDWIIK